MRDILPYLKAPSLPPQRLETEYTAAMHHSKKTEDISYDLTPEVDRVQSAVDLTAASMSGLRRVWIPLEQCEDVIEIRLGLQFHSSETLGTWVKVYNIAERGYKLNRDGVVLKSRGCVDLEVAEVQLIDQTWVVPGCQLSPSLQLPNTDGHLAALARQFVKVTDGQLPFLPGDIALNPDGQLVSLAQWNAAPLASSTDVLTAPLGIQPRGMVQPNMARRQFPSCDRKLQLWKAEQLVYPTDCYFTHAGWAVVNSTVSTDADFLLARARYHSDISAVCARYNCAKAALSCHMSSVIS